MATRNKTAPKAPKLKLHIPEPELKLDLGSGQNCREGFEGVDRFAPNAKHRVHLWSGERWPWEDSTVSHLNASHVIEHIKADDIETYAGERDAWLFFFDEAWRIAKPGATFDLRWPALKSDRAFQDPTHRRFIPHVSMYYLDRNWREMNKLDHYLGACDWVLESCTPTTSIENSKKPDVVQAKMFQENWNFSDDFVAVLKARKA